MKGIYILKTKSPNIRQEDHSVSIFERSEKNGHVPALLLFAGESKTEKLDLMSQLEKQLFNSGFQVGVINDDRIRQGLCENLGFSDEDLTENLRRAREMAFLMLEAGWIVMADLQSCSASLSDAQSIQDQMTLTSIQVTIKSSSKNQKYIEIKRNGIISKIMLKTEIFHRPDTIEKLVNVFAEILKKDCHP